MAHNAKFWTVESAHLAPSYCSSASSKRGVAAHGSTAFHQDEVSPRTDEQTASKSARPSRRGNDVNNELVFEWRRPPDAYSLHVLASLTQSVILRLQVLIVIEMCPFIGWPSRARDVRGFWSVKGNWMPSVSMVVGIATCLPGFALACGERALPVCSPRAGDVSPQRYAEENWQTCRIATPPA